MDLTQYGFPENWQRHSYNEYDCYRNRPLEMRIDIFEKLTAAGYTHYISRRTSGMGIEYYLYYFDLPMPFFVEIGKVYKTGVIDHMQYFRTPDALEKYGKTLVLKSRQGELPEGQKGLPGEASEQ